VPQAVDPEGFWERKTGFEPAAVLLTPEASPLRLHLGSRFRLGRETRPGHQKDVARSHIQPRVFVHLAAAEAASLRPFLTNDLGAADLARIVDEPIRAPPVWIETVLQITAEFPLKE